MANQPVPSIGAGRPAAVAVRWRMDQRAVARRVSRAPPTLVAGLLVAGVLLKEPSDDERLDGLDQRCLDRPAVRKAGVAHPQARGDVVIRGASAARGRRPRSTATARRRHPRREVRRCPRL